MNTLESVWAEGVANHEEHSDMGAKDENMRFLALALCGEAGELANFIKKEWRDSADYRQEIRLEIADVAAYTLMLAAEVGLKPQDLLDLIAHKQQVFRKKMAALQG